jgi:hypothetical protein
MQATGAGQTFTQCTSPDMLQATCLQMSPESPLRLDFECMKGEYFPSKVHNPDLL